jgi:hypothetical protein
MAKSRALDPVSKAVLEVLLDRSNIPGHELMTLTGHKDVDALIQAVSALHKSKLIQVAGNPSTAQEFKFARFGIRPSAKGTAYDLIG